MYNNAARVWKWQWHKREKPSSLSLSSWLSIRFRILTIFLKTTSNYKSSDTSDQSLTINNQWVSFQNSFQSVNHCPALQSLPERQEFAYVSSWITQTFRLLPRRCFDRHGTSSHSFSYVSLFINLLIYLFIYFWSRFLVLAYLTTLDAPAPLPLRSPRPIPTSTKPGIILTPVDSDPLFSNPSRRK